MKTKNIKNLKKICEGIDCPLAYSCKLHKRFGGLSFLTSNQFILIKERFEEDSKTCPDYEEHRFGIDE